MSLDPPAAPLEVYLLAEAEFLDVQALQRRLIYDLGEGGHGALVLCEHPPTITVGRAGSRLHILPDDAWLHHHRLRTHWVNRGGGCLLHLPGQLAAYAVVPLKARGLTVQGHLDRLHRVVIDLLAEFDLKGTTRPGRSGVFLGDARVASIGIAVNRWIAYYGLVLNVGPFLAPFGLIVEPGPDGEPVPQTSMESRRQRPAPMAKVREAAMRLFEAAYGYDGQHLYTDHPLIRKKARPHVYVRRLG